MGKGFRGKTSEEELRCGRAWLEEAHRPAASLGRFERVRTQNAKRIGVARNQQRFQTKTKLLRGRRL